MMTRSVRAHDGERWRVLPGDNLIPDTRTTLTHAITIRRSRHEVWPWLVQMGAGRAGWYSYDQIDNGGVPSAEQIIPELQHIAVGNIFPASPGATDAFVVLDYQAERFLILGWPSQTETPRVTWTFVLEEPRRHYTRLIVRARAREDYEPPFGLPRWAVTTLVPLGHGIMQRKQLVGIARRVERRPNPIWTLDIDELGLAPAFQD